MPLVEPTRAERLAHPSTLRREFQDRRAELRLPTRWPALDPTHLFEGQIRLAVQAALLRIAWRLPEVFDLRVAVCDRMHSCRILIHERHRQRVFPLTSVAVSKNHVLGRKAVQ